MCRHAVELGSGEGGGKGVAAAARDARLHRQDRADQGRAHLAMFAADSGALPPPPSEAEPRGGAGGGNAVAEDVSGGAAPPEPAARVRRRVRAEVGRADLERFSVGLSADSSGLTPAADTARERSGEGAGAPVDTSPVPLSAVPRMRDQRRGRAEVGRSSLQRFSAEVAARGGGDRGAAPPAAGADGGGRAAVDAGAKADSEVSAAPRARSPGELPLGDGDERALRLRLNAVAAAVAADDARAVLEALQQMDKKFGEVAPRESGLARRVSARLGRDLGSPRPGPRPASATPRAGGAGGRGSCPPRAPTSALQEVLASEFAAEVEGSRAATCPRRVDEGLHRSGGGSRDGGAGSRQQQFPPLPLIWARSVTRRYHDLAASLYRRGRPDRALEALDAVLGRWSAAHPEPPAGAPPSPAEFHSSPRVSASLRNLRGCILSDLGRADEATTEIEAALEQLGGGNAGDAVGPDGLLAATQRGQSRSPGASRRPAGASASGQRPASAAGIPPREVRTEGAALRREADPRAALGVALLHNLAVAYRDQGRLREAAESQEAASGLFSILLQRSPQARVLAARRHPWEASLRTLGRSIVALQLQESH